MSDLGSDSVIVIVIFSVIKVAILQYIAVTMHVSLLHVYVLNGLAG